jgi:hypothetical protein
VRRLGAKSNWGSGSRHPAPSDASISTTGRSEHQENATTKSGIAKRRLQRTGQVQPEERLAGELDSLSPSFALAEAPRVVSLPNGTLFVTLHDSRTVLTILCLNILTTVGTASRGAREAGSACQGCNKQT